MAKESPRVVMAGPCTQFAAEPLLLSRNRRVAGDLRRRSTVGPSWALTQSSLRGQPGPTLQGRQGYFCWLFWSLLELWEPEDDLSPAPDGPCRGGWRSRQPGPASSDACRAGCSATEHFTRGRSRSRCLRGIVLDLHPVADLEARQVALLLAIIPTFANLGAGRDLDEVDVGRPHRSPARAGIAAMFAPARIGSLLHFLVLLGGGSWLAGGCVLGVLAVFSILLAMV